MVALEKLRGPTVRNHLTEEYLAMYRQNGWSRVTGIPDEAVGPFALTWRLRHCATEEHIIGGLLFPVPALLRQSGRDADIEPAQSCQPTLKQSAIVFPPRPVRHCRHHEADTTASSQRKAWQIP